MSIVGFGRISVTKIENGTDAYSTFLSGYSFSVPTDSSLVVSELTSQTIQVYACKGETQINDFTIGKVTAPAELTVSVNNANKTVTLTANKGIVMSSSRAEIEIPIEITDVGSVIQVISFSCTIRGDDGVEGIGYSVIMDNESHLFEGSLNNALAGSVTAKVTAYKNREQVTSTIKSVDGKTISGNSTVNTTVTGLSATVSNNGTLNSAITFKSTTSLTTKSKAIPVVIDVDGKTFSKHFSYSIAFKGDKGDAGVSASYVTTVASSQIFKAGSDSTVYTPDESVITPTLTNCTFTSWEYSLDGGVSWTTAVSGTNGITISTVRGKANCLTISSDSGLFNTTNTIPFKINCSNGASDTVTIARLRDGNKGQDGISPGLVTITAKGGQAFVEKKNGKSYSPSSISLKPMFQNCEYSKWQYSLNPENESSWIDVVSGTHSMSIGSSTKVLTISPNSDLFADDTNAITFKVLSTEDGLTDVMTIARVKRGIGYTILLSNESYTFSGTTTHAIAETIPVEITGYWNSEVLPVTITSIGSNSVSEDTTNVSTGITGLTADVSGNGTMNCVITFKATTSLTQKSGVVEIGILFDNENIVKKFSYSVSMKGDPGKDGEEGTGYTILLSNESHQFEGTETAAKAGSATTTVVAYKNTTKSAVTITSIDGKAISGNTTVSTTVNGLSATVSNNGSTTADTTIKFTTTTSLTTASKAIPIVITVDGKTFTKYFSYSIAFKGNKGDTGASLYTWLKYADTPTSGMSDSPDGKTYMGLAYNKTSPTESTNYSDYTWSLIKGEQGVKGETGPDGKSLYTWVKYADDAKGTGMSDSPDGKEYIGLAYNKTTATESTTASDYTWSLIKGEQGVPGEKGETGNGISSVTEYYAVSTSNSTAPTSWQTTIQTMTATNKYLWNYEKITYTDGTTKDTAKRIIGVYGDKGNTGATGNGVKSIVNHYLASASNSGVTTSTSGWTETIQTVTSSKKYLWNYETITYTDNTVTTTTPCIIGVYGDKGDKGDTGATGNGIKSITEHYAVSASNTTAPTSWKETVQSMTATNKYLWNYETITYTNNSTVDTLKRVIGVYGDKGNTGNTGKGIKSIVNHYLASTSNSGVTTSTSGWSTTIQSVTSSKKYLWNYEVITYTDNTTTTTTPCIIGVYGDKGDKGNTGATGNGIKGVTNYYLATSTSSGVTTSTSGWTIDVQSVSAGKKYLWNYEVITYTDNATLTTTPCIIGAYGDKGATGAAGVSVTSVDVQYYLSTSSSTPTGGSWTTDTPAWVNGKYMWSKTVVTYSDTTSTESNPVCITGAKGNTGSAGTNGTNGTDGKGVKSIVEQYYQSTSATALSGGSWTTTYPGWVNGKYIWTRSVITYTDNATTTTTAVCVTGSKGATGATGAAGKGIKDITEYYAVSTSNSTAPTSWQTTIQPMTSSNKYLWNYEKITYTDDTTFTSAKRIIGVYGDKGDKGNTGSTGVGISAVTNYYLATSSSSGVTTSTSGWTTSVQSVTLTKKYLWNYEVITYTNSTTKSTSPCIIGVYGDKGDKGDKGATGNGISSITEHYAVSNSNSTAPTSWQTTVPSMSASNKYLWNYEKITYTDGTTKDTAKRVIGVYGDKGDAGVSVTSVDVQYYQSTSSTSLSGGSWSTTAPAWVNGKYIWTKTVIKYSNSTTPVETNPVCITGAKGNNGSDGKSITSIVEEYYQSTSSTSLSGGSWSTTAPTWVNGKYIWTRSVINYSTGSPTTTAAICVTGSKGNSGTAGTNTATVFLYQRATSTPAVPSSTLTYTFATRDLTDAGSWKTTIPSGTNPIYITSASVSANTATASITTKAWSAPVVLAKNGATGATGTSVNSIVTLYYASTSIDTPTPTPTAPSVSSNTISYGSWTDDPTEVEWSDKYVFTMTLVAFKSASGTITIDCSDATYDKTWEAIKETNTGMLQNSEMIGLIATKGSTGSAITLTDIMIAAMTSQFKIKAPNGSTTIIEGGKINTNTIVGTNGSINFSAGTFTYGNTTKGISWDGTNLNIYGAARISGKLEAATGTFAGSLSAATGTFSGELKAATGTFTGKVTATSGSFNGSVTATSLTVTKTIQMYNAACNATLPVLQFGDDRVLYIGGTEIQQAEAIAGIGVWGNVTVSGQVGANYLYGDSGISTNGTVSGSSFIASGGTFKGVKTATTVTTLGWGTNNDYCAAISLLAHWNGAYIGTSSNLAYCNRGAFGTIVTKSTSDYAPASHVHTQMATGLQVYSPEPDAVGKLRYVICTHNSNPVTRIWMSGTSTLGIHGKKGGTPTGSKSNFTLSLTSSDIRLKDNIKDSTINALPIIDSMRTREFDWNDGREDPHREIGIVADELQKLDSAFVVGGGVDENGDMIVKSVDTLHLSSYLIKGEQELHAKIKELQVQNEEKDKKINSLESTIQDLLYRVVQLESK